VLAGQEDLDRAATALAARLPESLGVLARLAYNYRWAWEPGGDALFERVDALRWQLCARNPVRLLQEASTAALERAAQDAELLERAAEIEARIRADLERPFAGPLSTDNPLAYFSAEFAVHQSLPIYSGGLGALAGDILKEASDLALPFVAVGLLYRQGYFRQRIDRGGWQHEYWVDTDPDRTPAALITGEDGAPLTVTVPIRGSDVVAQIWRVAVGRVPLLLLDAERPENDQSSRWITSRLYTSDPDVRLAQYVLLGVGGVRALEALGVDPGVVHLNEGHAAFAALELVRGEKQRGAALEEAFALARSRTIFTTHTPVPAGNDTYPASQVVDALRRVAQDIGAEPDALVRLGRTHPDDEHEPFGVTQFALRTSRAANGVSRRHGEVAREMWHALWPDRPVDEVPIGHVTNGVHLPTWLGGPMRALLDRHLPEDWIHHASDPRTWEAIDAIPAADLWAVRREQRATLVDYVRQRAQIDRLGRDEPRDYVERAAHAFDPDVLTLGFARRLATYKRMHLLFADADRGLNLLADGRPVQIVMAGKAHPRDDEGKRQVQALFGLKNAPQVNGRVVYLDDYDLGMAATLVRGCDVWVNLPRPPLEASGTSGMKNIANGGLHLSVLDGWWAEGYDGSNGWALPGEVDADHGAQDWRDGQELYRLLEQEVVPSFYDHGGDGVPPAWVARMRASLRTLAPRFSATRMLEDYVERMYAPHGAARND
jgi:starch phosphorylase